MRGVEAVLSAGAGHNAVIRAIVFPIAIAQVLQLPLALRPIDRPLLLLGHATGVAYAGLVEHDRLLLALARVLVLDRGIRALVGDDTARAEAHVVRQAIAGLM